MNFARACLGVAAPLLTSAVLLAGGTGAASANCQLNSVGNKIQHVIHIQFDNVHLRRDNPSVQSDLEQMPNLRNFLLQNGVLSGNHHTPLISHTADDIITTLTGVYGEKHGQPVSNSYGYYKPDGTVGIASSFAYWTDPAPDGKPTMVDQAGKTHPAPWVPFTRAGCDVGAFSTANIEFENVFSDVDNVFGPTSPQHAEAHSNFNKAVADFEGIAIHCAQNSPRCTGTTNSAFAQKDLLPDEPGGYPAAPIGPANPYFMALFGNANVQPVISPGTCNETTSPGPCVKDLDGNIVDDGNGNPGFPGFDPSASQALGYLAKMLEDGVPVVYAYIADAHDNHFTGSGSYGPGEAGYVAQLAAYDAAFGKFFARLSTDGITATNALFIVTSDENDHFAGQAGTPAGCDGIHTVCNYVRLPAGCDGSFSHPCTTTNLGEVGTDVRSLLLTEFPTLASSLPKFSVHNDDAPTVYIVNQPGATDQVTRDLEHNMAALQAFDPIPGGNVTLMQRMADPAEMALLHMVTSDPARTPTFTYFANDDFFITASSSAVACASISTGVCSNEQPGFNWNHGDYQRQITQTWLGMVGPGVRKIGYTEEVFSDHTDIRPTMLVLAGLVDDYAHDGRLLAEFLDRAALPKHVAKNLDDFVELAVAYKQINAPVGVLGVQSLILATKAINSSTQNDAAYQQYLQFIGDVTQDRNNIAGQMNALLEGAAFANGSVDDTGGLVKRAESLVDKVNNAVASSDE